MKSYNDLLNEYKKVFNDKETLRAFLFELCNEYGIDLYLEKDNEADERVAGRFIEGVQRLKNNEPLNYVLGYSYFYGYKMTVNKDVLIPRFETEELVGLILSYVDEYYRDQDRVTVGDIGTGSGAIAIALKKEEPKLEVYASDISAEAIEVAERNAANNGADVRFMTGSMLEPFIEKGIKLDILVSNPPYIKEDEVLEASVKDYEPHVALFGGNDGLKFYREIFENARKVIKEDGLLFFEIGYDQKENLTILAENCFKDAEIRVFKDINKKDRMLMINLKVSQ
ncbi:MAG: peptide chain release factor N(5)-glutamine methyltransferase [Erysipelotrichaceae bacterium]|nr:peptide chain release factor N(5)-glutamine methyltransferase [Erysipelotrichaceae bacterium]